MMIIKRKKSGKRNIPIRQKYNYVMRPQDAYRIVIDNTGYLLFSLMSTNKKEKRERTTPE